MKLTEQLVRRKAEHHDGPLPTLEELTLHQLELERIEPVLGSVCRKLRILYLQNNIIPRMEHLHHLKDLRYLNMGLNNCERIEGLASCEFLNKLDLIVNFIDVDELEASVEHLRPLLHLRELFLMGNPCAEWPGFRAFVVGSLPQLASLDGTEVAKAERIQAVQQLRRLRTELRGLAARKREEKGLPRAPPPPLDEDEEDDGSTEPWCPETRVKMYREMAEQKEEQEQAKRAREPRERDAAREQREAIAAVRARESEGPVRQCNEGRWDFVLEDEDGKGCCALRLGLSRFLDSSLVDVDVHPSYVSVVVKGKTFRILWPDEVRADGGGCQRSVSTGELVITAPKVREPSRALLELKRKERAELGAAGGGSSGGAHGEALRVAVAGGKGGAAAKQRSAAAAAAAARGAGGGVLKLAEEMRLAAVTVAGIVPVGGAGVGSGGDVGGGGGGGGGGDGGGGTVGDGQGGTSLFRAGESRRTGAPRRAAGAGDEPDAAEEAGAAEVLRDDEGDEVPGLS